MSYGNDDEQELEGDCCIACGTYHIVDKSRVLCFAQTVFIDEVSEEEALEDDSLDDDEEDQH